MNPSSKGGIIHETWSKWLIIILWACCGVSLLLCICQTIRERCMNVNQDPMHFFLRRRSRRRHNNHQANTATHEPSIQSESRGLAAAVIHSLPKLQFCEVIKGGSNNENTECAVCLSEFVEGEYLRLLPNCGHAFHATCIDTWFTCHSNCPLCRASVLHGFNVCSGSENRTEAHSAVNLEL